MSYLCDPFFRGFCLQNFPYIEKEFDGLTDYQIICKILETIENQIKAIDEKYQDILGLRTEFDEFKIQIQSEMVDFKNQIESDIETDLQENYSRIVLLLSEYQTVIQNQMNDLRSDLEDEIREIELGNVIAYNPTNR